MESIYRHVTEPTNATAQFFRVASGEHGHRFRVTGKTKVPPPSRLIVWDKRALLEMLCKAMYCSFLCTYCQGLRLLAHASRDKGWYVDLDTCIRIWRAGCIIQEEHIADMLEPILGSTAKPIMNFRLIDTVAADLHKSFPRAQGTSSRKAASVTNYVPSLPASLECLKYVGGAKLATQFMAAEMDFFGAHAFDRPGVQGEDLGKTDAASHHYEWRLA